MSDLSRDVLDRAVEAAVKEERERVKARVEAVRADAPAWPDDDSYEAGLDAALAAIDKEGEGEVNTTEEEGDRG